MSNAVFLYQNLSDQAVLSGGSWLSSLPVTNLQTADVGRVARSTNTLNASTLVVADLGLAQSIGGVVLGPTNMSPGAQYRFRAYSDVGLTALIFDSGTQTIAGTTVDWIVTASWLEWEDPGFWYGLPDSSSQDEDPLYLVAILATNVVAQFWKLDIFDAGNAEGYVQFGRLMIARALRPSGNYAESGNSLSMTFLTDVQASLGGRETYWERGQQRIWRCSFPSLDESELFGGVFDLMIRSKTSRQVFVAPDPASNLRRRGFLATLSAAPALSQFNFQRGSTAFDFKEVI